MEDILLWDHKGNPDANYWLARNLLRSKFGLTAEEADKEPASEVYIHLRIWQLMNEREEKEQKRQEARARMPKG